MGGKTCLGFRDLSCGEEALKPEQVGETERRRRRDQIGQKRNAPLWIRSRRRWARAWKVTGVFCTSLVGSMRTGRRTTKPPQRTLSLKPEVLAELDESAMATCA